jgi:hypothetical protein
MKDIECQVCHRITFAWEKNTNCQVCHWPVRPVLLEEPVFGWDVAIKIRAARGATEILEKHYFTSSESAARNRAKRTPNFVEIAAVRPLTESQWINSYGDPRDKSKFS